jgi:hypothetical protein
LGRFLRALQGLSHIKDILKHPVHSVQRDGLLPILQPTEEPLEFRDALMRGRCVFSVDDPVAPERPSIQFERDHFVGGRKLHLSPRNRISLGATRRVRARRVKEHQLVGRSEMVKPPGLGPGLAGDREDGLAEFLKTPFAGYLP